MRVRSDSYRNPLRVIAGINPWVSQVLSHLSFLQFFKQSEILVRVRSDSYWINDLFDVLMWSICWYFDVLMC